MHRVIAGCNLWAIVFLAAGIALAVLGSPWHLAVTLFAAIFTLLAQSAIFALFMGASKLLQEHVQLFSLPARLIERTNAILVPLFRAATVGSLAALLLGILTGLGFSGEVPRGVAAPAAAVVALVLLALLPRQVRGLAAMHEVLVEMEALLPSGAGDKVPGASPAEAARRGPIALAYVGSTALAMVLGYRYISGLPVPAAVLLTVVVLSLVCLVAAGLITLRARRA